MQGKLTIAGQWSEEQLSDLQARFAQLLGGDVAFDIRRNEKLIGGFVATVESRVYDASIASRLKDMVHHLTGSGQSK